jgi:hypothetical protein
LRISYESFLRSDSVILDVGANIGTHLEHFVRIAKEGRVFAFEPLPDLFQSLVERFQPDGVVLSVYNLALSSFLQFIGTRELWDIAKARYCWDYFLIPEERVADSRSPFFE